MPTYGKCKDSPFVGVFAILEKRLLHRLTIAVDEPNTIRWSAILRVAKQIQPTLIVLGSQGRGFIADVYLGSVSHHIVRQAGVSVLLVPARRA